MGLLSILKKIKSKDSKEARILVLGLDNAGKTTILKRMSEEDINQITPTQGFNIKSLVHDGFKLNVWDIGGQESIREYWKNYFENTDGLIFVVDSSDKHRIAECATALGDLMENACLSGIPMLVFANKQDLSSSCEPGAIVSELELEKLKDRTWNIQACSAKTGEGLQEGLEWMVREMEAKKV